MISTTDSEFDVVVMPEHAQARKVNVVLVSSVALSFISFWRAAAIVLNDMASTVYYIGGGRAPAVGQGAARVGVGGVAFPPPGRAGGGRGGPQVSRAGGSRGWKDARA